jgi:hypothetical protein
MTNDFEDGRSYALVGAALAWRGGSHTS